MPDSSPFDDILAEGAQPAAGVFDDILADEKPAAGAFDDILATPPAPVIAGTDPAKRDPEAEVEALKAQPGPSSMAGLAPETTGDLPAAGEAAASAPGEFSKGFSTGVVGAKGMGVAAATIPLAAVTRNLLKAVEGFDAVERGEGIPTGPAVGARGDYVYDQIARYQAAAPEERAKMRSRAGETIASSQESKAGLVALYKQYQEEMRPFRGRVQDATDIRNIGDFQDWFLFNFGQGLPYMAASIASGLAAGPAGLAASGFAMGAGDIQGEMIEKGKVDTGGTAAVIGAVPYALLDFLGPAGRMFRGTTRQGLQQAAEAYFKRLGKAVPKNAVEEFVNEAGQEIVKDATVSTQTGEKIITDENLWKWVNAGAAGAAAGGPFGVAEAGLPGRQAPPAPSTPTPPSQETLDAQAEAIRRLSPSDLASPIQNDALAKGREILAQAEAAAAGAGTPGPRLMTAPPPTVGQGEPIPPLGSELTNAGNEESANVSRGSEISPSGGAVDVKSSADGTGVQSVRGAAPAEAPLVQGLPRREHEGVAAGSSPDGRAAGQADGASIRQGVPDQGETGAGALSGVRQPGESDAPPGLQQATGSRVDVSSVPSGGAQAPVGDGTRAAPVKVEAGEHLTVGNENVNTEPSPEQAAAGNYEKKHLRWEGFAISIENPKGTIRRNKNPDGPKWEVEMPSDYGDIKGTKGADGDNIDISMGPNPNAPTVFVIDQRDEKTGKFDEHKVKAGFDTEEQALNDYFDGFSDGGGPARLGAITAMSRPEFKAWANDQERTTRAVAYKDEDPTQAPGYKPDVGTTGPQTAPAPVDVGTTGPQSPHSAYPKQDELRAKIRERLEAKKRPVVPEGYEVDEPEIASAQEANLHGGKYSAVARRIKPWSVEKGYGDTEAEAMRDALRRLKAPEAAPVTAQTGQPKVAAAKKPAGNESATSSNNESTKPPVGERAAFEKTISQRGAARNAVADYSIQQLPDRRGFYFVRTQAGKRTTGGVDEAADGKPWTREEAIRRATDDAHPEREPTLVVKSLQTGKTTEIPGRRVVGKNAAGEEIEEDDRGVRSILKDGVRSAESVRLIPTRDGDGTGIRYVRPSDARRDDRYKTTAETGEKPEAKPEPAKPPAGEEPESWIVIDSDTGLVSGDWARKSDAEHIAKSGDRRVVSSREYKPEPGPRNTLNAVAVRRPSDLRPGAKVSLPTLFRGVEGGTDAAKAIRKTADGDLGDGIYVTQHKWLAETYGGGPKASVKDGSRVVHTYELTRDLSPGEVAFYFKADPADPNSPFIVVTGEGKELARAKFGAPALDAAVNGNDDIKVVVGAIGGAYHNQISIKDPALLRSKPSEQAPTSENIPDRAKAGNNESTTAPSVWTPAERDRAEELRIRIRNKLRNQTNAGIDPELLALGAELAALHIKAGARRFVAFAKAMAADLERSLAELKPYLRSWYMGAQLMMEDSGLDVSGMDDAETVKAALASLTAEPAAPEKKPEPARDYGTAEKPNVFALGQAVAEHFSAGNGFANIIQARAFIGERLGTKIDSKSVIAKQADEAIEIGVVLAAREIALINKGVGSEIEKFNKLVGLYGRQPKLDTRTSTSAEQQAYSTPAPLAFIASRLAHVSRAASVYEPTAGNGMLLLEAPSTTVVANELNDARRASLKQVLDGATVTGKDAAESDPPAKVDVVIANPPFGKVKEGGVTRLFPLDGRMTKEIDLGISWRALKSMKDDGRAVLIIGSKRGTQEERAVEYRSFETMSFMKKLYDAYNVVDHFSVDGKLYDRQGAGWPVDVIVIEGRGASKFPAPYARVPDMLGSWDEVGRKLDDRVDATGSAAGPGPRPAPAPAGSQAADPGLVPGGAGSQNQPVGGTGGPGGRPRPAPYGGGQGGPSGGGPVASGGSAGGSVARPEEGGGVPAGAGPTTAQSGPGGRGNAEGGDAGGVPVEPVLRTPRVERKNLEAESALSVQYAPKSNSGFAVGTLVPRAMQAAMRRALDALEARVGDIDQFVADKLGMTLFDVIGSNEKEGYFSAEQVDALALAIDNVEKGGAFIIGDQTGVGKGRFVAAMLKYGLQSNKVPVFFTKDPGLYADMIRDLRDIGMGDIHKRILVTNNDLREGKSVPLSAEDDTDRLSSPPPSEHAIALAEIIASGRLPDGYEMLFTTYSQVQYGPKGLEYDRQKALMALSPNAMIVLDESHEAGGQEAGRKKINKETGQEIRGRADFVRDMLRDAQGAVYSSATYAKNPAVMSLYFRTDLSMAVEKIEDLSAVIKAGGVPLQQVVANMLVEGGQYARRERSFEGVKMDMDILPTDIKTATEAAATLRTIFRLDADHMEDVRKGFIEEMASQGVKGGADGAVGQGSASQTGFASIMHNVVSQMLLALNAPSVVDKAIALHKAGKKPIIALANTNEAIIDDFVEQEGLRPGDEVSPTFNLILDRYLKRLRRITLKDENDKKTHVYLTDDDIRRLGGPGALKAFKEAEKLVTDANLSSMPANPIDYIMDRLNAAGVKVDEITGRSMVVKDGILGARRGSPAEKVRMRNAFNTGGLDALVINRSGSTGLSLHALLKGGNDGKQRHMIILQPDPNIDVFMQMLGRIHRTGQIRLPEYTIAASDLAIARRPAAVLMRKLASLSANTTANKKSAISIDTVVDFFNKYGDEVVAEYMLDHPEIAELVAIKGFSLDNVDGLAAKFTGRLAIIEPSEVGKIYDDIEAAYTEHVEALDRMGLNTLEAKTLELGARTLETATLVDEKDSSSPFGAAAMVETVDAKKMGKAYTVEEAQEAVRKILDGKTPRAYAEDQADALQALGPSFLERLDARIERARAKLEELTANPEASAKQKEAAAENVARWMEAKDEAQAKIDRIAEAATTYRPGAALTLLAKEGEAINAVPAIAMGINIKGIRDNPTVMSAVKVKFAVADGSREVTVPLSKLLGASPQFSTEASDSATVIEAFRSGVREARERRQIITGNLVAGFAQFKKGQFVMFTNAEGEVRQGILMPRDFNANTEMARKPARFDNPAHVVEFLMSGKNTRRVQTEDGIVGISFGASGFDIAVMNKGGKPYYLNQPARAAVGDFQARRGNKVWNPITRPGERAVIALVKAWQENLDAKFITTLDKGEARKITGEKTGLDSRPTDPDDDGGGSGGGSKFQRPYYSALADAIPRLPPKGAGAQMLKTLENMQGVKGAEIAAVGLDDWLKGQERVTREQVQEYVAQNAVEIKEVTKQEGGPRPSSAQMVALDDWFKADKSPQAMTTERSQSLIERAASGDRIAVADLEGLGVPDDLLAPFRAHVGGEGGPKFNRPDTTLPGGENYREVLLTLPMAAPKFGVFVGDSMVLPREYDTAQDARDAGKRAGLEGRASVRQLGDENRNGADVFKGGHFDEPNVLAHIRLNDRAAEDGKRVLFVEEIQDDWAQKARKLREDEIKRRAAEKGIRKPTDKSSAEARAAWEAVAKTVPEDFGYRKTATKPAPKALNWDDVQVTETEHQYKATTADGRSTLIGKGTVGSRREAQEYAARYLNGLAMDAHNELTRSEAAKFPDRPWKSSNEWGALAMRRVLKLAADEGYDRVAWTPGEIQNDRYNLAKKISEIHYSGTNFVAYDHDGGEAIKRTGVKPEDLPDLIGKELADRLMEQTPKGTLRSLRGLDLQVGGSGMIGFYDKMLVNYANSFGRKYGAKVGTTTLYAPANSERGEWVVAFRNVDGDGAEAQTYFNTEADAEEWMRALPARFHTAYFPVHYREKGRATSPTSVHSIDVTPAMREALADKGVALFQQGSGARTDRGPTASWQVAPDLKAEYLLKPEYVARRAEIADVLFELLKKLTTSKRAVLNLADLLTGTDAEGGKSPVSGAYSERANQQGIIESIVSLALIDPKTGEIQNMRALMKTLNHEVLHFLWERNLLTAEEKQVLTDAAEAGNWIGRHKIKEGYADLDHAGQIIEAIAEERGDYALGKRRVGKSAAGIFDRIGEMFERLKNWLTGHGFRSFEDIMRASDRVMDKIGSGEIGRREEPSAEALAGDAMAASALSRGGKPTLEGLGYRQDNPAVNGMSGGKAWLREKQEIAQERYDRTRGISGATTAWLSGITLKTSALKDLEGARRERRGPGDQQYDWLAERVAKNGWEADHPILVEINHHGEVFITEGNTRVAYAARNGIETIRADVKWLNGGEMADGSWSPEKVLDKIAASTKYSRPPRPPGANDTIRADDPETERRRQQAMKGVGDGDGMLARVKDWGTAIAQGFDRHWIDLPNTPRFSDVAQQLLKLQAAPHRSKDKIVALLKSVVAGMTRDDLEIFSWKIVLDDLTYEVEQEHLIPFGLTPDTVVSELAKVDAILARRPDLAAAVERRKVIVQGIKNDLVEAGILSAENAQNPAYYRHQVLLYAMATKRYAKGVGKSVRTPYWAKREGSLHDINLNYLEAEFDHLHKSFVGLETVRLIDWIKESAHNIRADVLDRARAANAARVEEKLEAERDRFPPRGGPLNREWAGFRQRIAMGLDHLRRVLEDEEINVPPQYRDAADDIMMQRENEDGQLFNFVNWILTSNQPGSMGAAMIFKAISQRREWTKALLGKRYADTMNPGNLVAEFAPEGYVAWQPDDPDAKGKAMRLFTAKTVPEHAIDQFVRKLVGNTTLPKEFADAIKRDFEAQAREVLAVGGPRYQMIIPQELADTLSNFNSPFDESVVAAVLEVPTRWWKVWTLFNPRRAPKYILNNWSGDLDAVIAGNPAVLKKAGQARREIWDVLVKGKEPTNPRYTEALDRNVFQTGLTIQEIPDINSLSEFEALMNPTNWKSPASITKLAFKKGWGFVRTTAVLRESIYRYAAYLDYIERIERGDPMDKIPYGASNRPMVEVVEDPKDRAALLARDLVGDYANTSVIGQQLARFVAPFWRFQEINIKRYYRLTSNAFGQGIGKGLRTGGMIGATVGAKTTLWLLTRMGALYASIMIWNALMFPDDDDEMDPEERARLHINLGRWNGERVSLRISGASSDAFSWMGFGDALRTLQEVENGRASVGDILAAIAKAPFVKAVNTVSPFIKAPVELAGGIKFFPDVTKPVPIRDRWRYAFDTFTLGHEYDALADKPSRGYGQSWKESIVSARDSGAAAYGRVQGIAHKWLEREKGVEGFTTISTEKSRLLREWKLAQKFGDQDMADRRYDELIDLGETPKSLKDAAKNAHPLNAIAVKDRAAFMESLTADEERVVDMAVDWYNEVFTP